jgi:hypothetical protein
VSGSVWGLRAGGGARGVPGVAVDLLRSDGIRSVRTDARGHYSIAGASGVTLTVEVPVLQDSLADDRAVPPDTAPGRDGSFRRSLGVVTADLDEIRLPGLASGQRVTARDFGFTSLPGS